MKWWRNWKVLREKRRITKRIERLNECMADRTCTTTLNTASEINKLVRQYNELKEEA